MKITKTIEISLSPDEIKEILIDHIKKTQNVDVEHIHFSITEDYGDERFQDRQPTHVFGGVKCSITEIE